jgi:uncharacterized cupredoxin-like copper-binding protein
MAIKSQAGWVVLAALGAWLAAGGTAGAKGDLAGPKASPVLLTLGNADSKTVFSPKHLAFETGKLYKLLLINPSPEKHEFDGAALAEAVYTRKVEVVGPDGTELAEIKGSVREIKVMPGTTVEWYFVPVRTVKRGEFVCAMPGHKEAGMVGTFSIE